VLKSTSKAAVGKFALLLAFSRQPCNAQHNAKCASARHHHTRTHTRTTQRFQQQLTVGTPEPAAALAGPRLMTGTAAHATAAPLPQGSPAAGQTRAWLSAAHA
jgi:hypothetical protein